MVNRFFKFRTGGLDARSKDGIFSEADVFRQWIVSTIAYFTWLDTMYLSVKTVLMGVACCYGDRQWPVCYCFIIAKYGGTCPS